MRGVLVAGTAAAVMGAVLVCAFVGFKHLFLVRPRHRPPSPARHE